LQFNDTSSVLDIVRHRRSMQITAVHYCQIACTGTVSWLVEWHGVNISKWLKENNIMHTDEN